MSSQYRSVINANLPTQVVSIVADLLREQGISETSLLEGTTLTLSSLRNQKTFIQYSQLLKILDNALTLYPDPGLGLAIGRREHIASWGLLGFAIMSAADIRSAMEVGDRYYLSGPAIYDLNSRIEGDECVIDVTVPQPIGRLLPVVIEEIFATILTVFPELTGVPFVLEEIQVMYDKPEYSSLYDDFFRCPIEYNASANRLIFDSSYLDVPLINANPVSAKLCQQLCEKALKNQIGNDDLCQDIKSILLRAPERSIKMDSVAEELGMNIRTLRRRLLKIGMSYQVLVDEVRRDLAIEYLSEGHLSLSEVAYRVGFTEYGNFRKAFKRWTGHAPSHFKGSNKDTGEED